MMSDNILEIDAIVRPRIIRVDRSRTPKQVLEATGRVKIGDPRMADRMPRGEGDQIEIFLVSFGRCVNDEELEEALDHYGFKSVDPYSLAAMNEQDKALATKYPNCTQWLDRDELCSLNFRAPAYGCEVSRHWTTWYWTGRWWYGVVRKQ